MKWTSSSRARAWTLAAAFLICIAGIFAASGIRWLSAIFAFGAVVALSRTDLTWIGSSPRRRILRRILRAVVYLPALIVFGIPFPKLTITATLYALVIGAIPLFFEQRNLRIAFSPAYLQAAPTTTAERIADLISDSSPGVCQEYLYRGIMLSSLLGWNRWIAIFITALAFSAEHLLHRGGMIRWDVHDVIIFSYLGFALGVLVVFTNSLPAAIIGHSVYNAPNIILTLQRPRKIPGQEANEDIHYNVTPEIP